MASMRNAATNRASLKLDRQVNLKTSSFKSRLPPASSGSAVHRSNLAFLASEGFKNDDGGFLFIFVDLFDFGISLPKM